MTIALSKVRIARIRARFTLLDITDRTRIDETRVSRLERGIRAIRRDEAEAVARALKMKVEDLFEEQSEGRFVALDDDNVVAA